MFDDGLENGDRDSNLDPLDGMNVENCDYTITSCVKDREQDREGPLTSSVSAESQSISMKRRINYQPSFERSDFYGTLSPAYVLAYPLLTFFDSAFLAALLRVNGDKFVTVFSAHVIK